MGRMKAARAQGQGRAGVGQMDKERKMKRKKEGRKEEKEEEGQEMGVIWKANIITFHRGGHNVS